MFRRGLQFSDAFIRARALAAQRKQKEHEREQNVKFLFNENLNTNQIKLSILKTNQITWVSDLTRYIELMEQALTRVEQINKKQVEFTRATLKEELRSVAEAYDNEFKNPARLKTLKSDKFVDALVIQLMTSTTEITDADQQ